LGPVEKDQAQFSDISKRNQKRKIRNRKISDVKKRFMNTHFSDN